MTNEAKSSKFRFGVFDAVIIIVVIALIASLIFRFTSDKNLFSYNTEKYTVTVKASGLQYTTIDLISAGDILYLEDAKQLGTFKNSPTVTPMLQYNTAVSGDIIASYYPDNTLVDITALIECSLISADGAIMTDSGIHIAAGVKLQAHTQSVNLILEVVSVDKTISD